MRCSLKHLFATIIDVLIFAIFIFIVFVVISGGYSLVLFGANLSAHTTSNPAKVLILLFILRKLIDRKTTLSDIPLVKLLRRIFLNQKSVTQQPTYAHLAVMVSLYAVVMSAVVIMKHLSYQTHAYDLGIFDQLLWSVRNGHGLHSSILGHHFFGEHFAPILYPLSDIYLIRADPISLLVFQTLVLACGAVPVWWLAEKELGNRNWALIFSLIYLCYQPLRGVNLYDFHPIALATPLLLFAFWYLNERKYGVFLIFLSVALLCKEEISEIIFIFGVYILLFHRKRIFGSSLIVAGIAFFALAVWLIIPHFRKTGEEFIFVHRYDYLGHSFREILTTLIKYPIYVIRKIFTPEKIKFSSNVFGPIGYLSLLSPSHLILAVPTFLQSILSSYEPQYSIKYQYTAPLTPFVFISAIFGMKNLLTRSEKWLQQTTSIVGKIQFQRSIAVILLLVSLMFFGWSPVGTFRECLQTPKTKNVRELLNLVPSTASVSAIESFVPHLSHRRRVYVFPDINNAKYIVLDSEIKWPLGKRRYFKKVRELLNGEYEIAFTKESLLLLRRNEKASNAKKLPPDFLDDRDKDEQRSQETD